VIKKFKLWFSIISLVSITNFISLPAQATSNDAITLESISAVSSTVLTGENIVMQLEVAVPTGYTWDPVNGVDGSQLPVSVLICPSLNWNGTRCSGSSQTLSADAETNLNLVTTGNNKVFQIKKIASLGNFILYKVVIPQPSLSQDVHTYNRNASFSLDSWGDPTDIPVPTFLNGDVSVVAPSPTPTPTPTISETSSPTPTPTPTATESATEVVVTISSSSSGSSSAVARTVAPVLIPIAIEASGKTIRKIPSKNGDLTWQRAKEISSSSGWGQKKNRRASGGKFISTSNPLAKLNISTSGDAFTLRYMTGKNMGKIRVMVDGKKLAEFKTSSLTTRSKAKSWIGIGPGKHKIEIIPILDPGQSIGVDAFQVARAV
jgi:hypothetical protein